MNEQTGMTEERYQEMGLALKDSVQCLQDSSDDPDIEDATQLVAVMTEMYAEITYLRQQMIPKVV